MMIHPMLMIKTQKLHSKYLFMNMSAVIAFLTCITKCMSKFNNTFTKIALNKMMYIA